MPFKKLHSEIKELLEQQEISIPTPFQKKSIPVIKSGAKVFCTAPKGSGKTTTLILTTLNKLKFKASGTAPRAIILVENKERVSELYDAFLEFTRYNSLRVYLCDEKVHIDLLKSEIFEGVDILISTPKTMNKLFLSNAVNTTLLSIFSVDDAEFLVQKSANDDLMAVAQSISKCQFVIYSVKMDQTLRRFQSYFMEYSKIVSLK